MPVDCQKLIILDTRFGFFGLIFQGSTVLHLSLGHTTRKNAKDALRRAVAVSNPREISEPPLAMRRLVAQLLAYTEGAPKRFNRVRIDADTLTPFARRVMQACRNIPYGHSITYGGLAHRAGSPGAARAVGSVMAKNRFPLIVPCHRVVAAGGRLGGFSAAGGQGLKRRLLQMEARVCGGGTVDRDRGRETIDIC